jgi:hypothetical protein
MQEDLFPETLETVYIEGDSFDLSKPPIPFIDSDKFWVKTNMKRISFLLDLPENLYYIFRNVKDRPAVFNTKSGKYLKPSMTRDVYPCVSIKGKLFYIHTLVAIYFIENDSPEIKCIVDHKNHDHWDYTIDNLEWVTASENVKRGKKASKPIHGFNRQTGEMI